MHLVADVGNTRIKWGLCTGGKVADSAALSDDPDAWRRQLDAWKLQVPQTWTLAGSDPGCRDRLAEWLKARGDQVCVLADYRQIPLPIRLPQPERIGVDRLVNALAARARVPSGAPAVIADLGSAVTVDLLDESGAFAGGAIFPGMRMMATALNDHTAVLPCVDPPPAAPPVPGMHTAAAIQAGIFWSVAGGIAALARQISIIAPSPGPLRLFLTGGDALRLEYCDFLDRSMFRVEVAPLLTLEGILQASEASMHP